MSNETDVVAEINSWLAEIEAEEASRAEIIAATTAKQPPPPPSAPTPSRPPRVGTIIQRSDRDNARKAAILMAPHPPPPKRRALRPFEKPPQAQRRNPEPTAEPLLQPAGPLPAPPTRFEVEPGVIVEVPHFAIHTARRYKARTPQGRWVLRFARDGSLRYRRKIA